MPSRTVDAAKNDPHEHPFNEEPPHADRAARRRAGPKKRSVSVRSASGTLRRGLGARPEGPHRSRDREAIFEPYGHRGQCGSPPAGTTPRTPEAPLLPASRLRKRDIPGGNVLGTDG